MSSENADIAGSGPSVASAAGAQAQLHCCRVQHEHVTLMHVTLILAAPVKCIQSLLALILYSCLAWTLSPALVNLKRTCSWLCVRNALFIIVLAIIFLPAYGSMQRLLFRLAAQFLHALQDALCSQSQTQQIDSNTAAGCRRLINLRLGLLQCCQQRYLA